jgi:hypothetical protein
MVKKQKYLLEKKDNDLLDTLRAEKLKVEVYGERSIYITADRSINYRIFNAIYESGWKIFSAKINANDFNNKISVNLELSLSKSF